MNLATRLLVDGFNEEYDQAVVVSNDADFASAMRYVRDNLRLRVVLVNPDSKNASPRNLSSAATYPESTDRRREDSGRGQGSYKRDDGCLNSGRLEVGGGLQALLWAPMGPVLAVVSEMAG